MGLSWSHILIVVLLFVLLFGRNKISELMGDFAKGIKSFKAGMADDEPDEKVIEHKPAKKPQSARMATAKRRANSKHLLIAPQTAPETSRAKIEQLVKDADGASA